MENITERKAREQIYALKNYGVENLFRLSDALDRLKTAAKSLETALAVAEAAKRYGEARKARTGQGEAYFRLREARTEWMRLNFGG